MTRAELVAAIREFRDHYYHGGMAIDMLTEAADMLEADGKVKARCDELDRLMADALVALAGTDLIETLRDLQEQYDALYNDEVTP